MSIDVRLYVFEKEASRWRVSLCAYDRINYFEQCVPVICIREYLRPKNILNSTKICYYLNFSVNCSAYSFINLCIQVKINLSVNISEKNTFSQWKLFLINVTKPQENIFWILKISTFVLINTRKN